MRKRADRYEKMLGRYATLSTSSRGSRIVQAMASSCCGQPRSSKRIGVTTPRMPTAASTTRHRYVSVSVVQRLARRRTLHLNQVAAITALTRGLLALPESSGLLTPAQRASYAVFEAILPPLPLAPGGQQYAPAEVIFCSV